MSLDLYLTERLFDGGEGWQEDKGTGVKRVRNLAAMSSSKS